MDLAKKRCVPCEGNIKPLSNSQIQALLKNLTEWEKNSDEKFIKRRFKFKNFIESLEFVNKIGAIAEEENHHPDLEFGWGYCEVRLYTHSINGLHENDFIVASKINNLKK